MDTDGQAQDTRGGVGTWVLLANGVMGAAALDALAAVHRPRLVATAEPTWRPGPVRRAASRHRLPVAAGTRVDRHPVADWAGVAGALDLVIVACASARIPARSLASTRLGWWNLHPSALPQWRGADPVGWQLLTGARRIGCTVHDIVPRLDAGAVLARGSIDVVDGQDRGALLGQAGTALGALAAACLDRVAAGEDLPARPQAAQDASWAPPAGVAVLLDPRALSAAAVVAAMRAFSPQPGVAVLGAPGQVRLANGQRGARLTGGAVPGRVTATADGSVAVACRDRWVHAEIVAGRADALPLRRHLPDPALPPA